VSRPASFPIVLSDSQQGKNISSNAPDGKERTLITCLV
jgi:hypothetical protein